MAAFREAESSNEAVTVSTPFASSALAAGFVTSAGKEARVSGYAPLHAWATPCPTSGDTSDLEDLRSFVI